MGHGSASDLFTKFNEGLNGIEFTRLIQVSMDGLSVNLKFHEKVEKCQEETELRNRNIECCSLHVVHGH